MAATATTSRPCLVLIPGLLNDADLWRDQVSALSDRYDVRVADITAGEAMDAMARAVLDAAPRPSPAAASPPP